MGVGPEKCHMTPNSGSRNQRDKGFDLNSGVSAHADTYGAAIKARLRTTRRVNFVADSDDNARQRRRATCCQYAKRAGPHHRHQGQRTASTRPCSASWAWTLLGFLGVEVSLTTRTRGAGAADTLNGTGAAHARRTHAHARRKEDARAQPLQADCRSFVVCNVPRIQGIITFAGRPRAVEPQGNTGDSSQFGGSASAVCSSH